MKWKTNKGPKRGDRKHNKYFAFFPTTLDDGYTVWLESYWAEEEWESDSYPGWRRIFTWRNT